MSVFMGEKCGVCGLEISLADATDGRCWRCRSRFSDQVMPVNTVQFHINADSEPPPEVVDALANVAKQIHDGVKEKRSNEVTR